MCTVTFVSTKDSVFLTSNRDEKASRGKALTPRFQLLPNGQRLLFPKDPDAGGSWIAVKNTGDAAVLLNGAFAAHQRRSAYRRSRGLVLMDMISAEEPLKAFRNSNLGEVEPFTLILFFRRRLYECRWDGLKKHEKELDTNGAYIWSSATLYDAPARTARERWFNTFLSQHPAPTQADILHFHHTGGEGQPATDVRMKREGIYTVSITSLRLSANEAVLHYEDLVRQTTVEKSFDFSTKRR